MRQLLYRFSRSGFHHAFILSASFLLISLFLSIIRYFQFNLVDDAFIPMVYVRNFLHGDGIVFYPGGERVEGFSSPIWTLYLVLGALLHIPLPKAAYIGGLLTGCGVLFLTPFLYKTIYSPDSDQPKIFWGNFLLPAFFLTADFSFTGWAASGMETTGYTLVLLATVTMMVRRASSPILFLLSLLLALFRPEGFIFIPLVFLHLFHQEKNWRKVVLDGLILLLIPLGLFILSRYLYFGVIFPNSFYAKHNYGGLPMLSRGFSYLLTFFIPRPLFAFALLGLLLEDKITRERSMPVFGFLLVHLLIIALEGGDHFTLHRLLVPILPLICIYSVRGIELCVLRFNDKRIQKPSESTDTITVPAKSAWRKNLLLWLIFPVLAYGHSNQIFDYRNDDYYHFSKGVQWLIDEAKWAKGWQQIGIWLKEKYPSDTLIAVVTAGAIPYYSELPTVDLLGINTRAIAYGDVGDTGMQFPGHEKSNPYFVLYRRPIFVQLFPLLFFSSYGFPEKGLPDMLTYPAQKDLWYNEEFRLHYKYKIEQTKYGLISYYERID